MFVLGHLGYGLRMRALFWRKSGHLVWIALGSLLPDLIDKPIYYGLVWWTGKHGADLGLISGTRTFGHSGLFLMILGFVAWRARSAQLGALVFGLVTHLFLDGVMDTVSGVAAWDQSHALLAFLFPLLGARFGVATFAGISEHVASIGSRFWILFFEATGLLFFTYEVFSLRKRSESPMIPAKTQSGPISK